jgi:hypothetical protein
MGMDRLFHLDCASGSEITNNHINMSQRKYTR